MKLDIQTLAFISCLTFLTQFVALFVQYSINKTYRGVVWWLLGSTLWALGVIFMPLVNFKPLEMLARIANPLTVLGLIFLYVGIRRFLDTNGKQRVLILIFAAFVFSYYYFMFVNNSISGRSVSISCAFVVVSIMAASSLLMKKDRRISSSARFTALVFMAFGCFSASNIFAVLVSPPIQNYSDQGMLALTFVVPIITSLLWTFGFIIMVNQRLNAENREEKEKLQLIFNTSPDAALISRLDDGTIVDVNAGFLTMSGYSRMELLGNSTIQINVWQKISDRERFINQIKDKGFCENLEFVFQRKDSSLLTGGISARIIPIQAVPHIVSVIHDITQNKLAEEALRESEELYRSILNASPDDITITDLKGCVLVISPAAKKMFGYEPDYDSFIGTQLLDYIVPEDRDRARSNIMRMRMGESTGPNEYRALRKDNNLFDIEVNSGLIYDANHQPAKMVFIVRDITERKHTEEHIQQLVQQLEFEKASAQLDANTDGLTGLANRRYFDEALGIEFYRCKRSGGPLSLIMLDVDHFKKFNDRYGHLAGDDCLRQIGITLKDIHYGGRTDIVARYGGEEFVVILADTDPHGASTLAERIRKAVEALAIPHADSGVAEYVTVSLGVVTINPAHLNSAEQVVALADDAMYTAKELGRNRISVAAESTVLG